MMGVPPSGGWGPGEGDLGGRRVVAAGALRVVRGVPPLGLGVTAVGMMGTSCLVPWLCWSASDCVRGRWCRW